MVVDDGTMSQTLFEQVGCLIHDLNQVLVFAEKSIEHGNVPDVV